MVKAEAITCGIWDLVNPDDPRQPLKKPIMPALTIYQKTTREAITAITTPESEASNAALPYQTRSTTQQLYNGQQQQGTEPQSRTVIVERMHPTEMAETPDQLSVEDLRRYTTLMTHYDYQRKAYQEERQAESKIVTLFTKTISLHYQSRFGICKPEFC